MTRLPQLELELGKVLGAGRRARRPVDPLVRRARNDLAKARRLIVKHALRVELESLGDGAYNVWPPRHLSRDPFEGDHFAPSGSVVLHMVQRYIKIDQGDSE